MSPLYHIVRVFLPSCPASLTAGLLTVLFQWFQELIGQKTIVQRLNALRCSPLCLFLFVFDFARSPTDAKPPGEPRALPVGASRYALRCSPQPAPSGLACLARCHYARLLRLAAFSLWWPLGFVQVVLSQHGHRL